MLTIRPRGAQLPQEGVGDIEHAVEIDGHDILPVPQDCVRVGREGVAAIDAGVVHEHRGLSDPARNVSGNATAGVAVGDIELEALPPSPVIDFSVSAAVSALASRTTTRAPSLA
jgi:hypothetical protein